MKTGFPIQSTMPLQKDAAQIRDEREAQLQEASTLYEKQFLHEMVDAMRKTVQHSELTQPTMAEKIYQDDLYQKYVDQWSERGGVGLADMIHDQLKAQIEILENGPGEKPKGPLPIEKNQPLKLPTPSDLRIETKKQGDQNLGFLFEKSEFDQGAYPVLSPWKGRVTQAFRTSEGRSVLQLDHGQGLTSKISFLGASVANLNDVEAGQVLGSWAPEGRNLHWTVQGKKA